MDNYSNDEYAVRFRLWLFIVHPDIDKEAEARKSSRKDFTKKHYPNVWVEWGEFNKSYPYKGYIGL